MTLPDERCSTASAKVGTGSRVTLCYTLSTDEEIWELSTEEHPFLLTIGAGHLHPALEKILIGRSEGESFTCHLHAEMAFGPRNPDLRLTLKREDLPERVRDLQEEDAFEAPGPDRKMHLFRVIRADATSITLDGNHPLAGYDMIFEGKILKLLNPT